jgi:hypothetical protein
VNLSEELNVSELKAGLETLLSDIFLNLNQKPLLTGNLATNILEIGAKESISYIKGSEDKVTKSANLVDALALKMVTSFKEHSH